MLRLSVRSPRDGVLLVRIVQRKGTTFVLDFGDPQVITDATRRVARGFTLWRMGDTIEARADDPRILTWLAEHYAGEGFLVAVEEPNWPERFENMDEGELSDDSPTEVMPRPPST